jgi:colanic acid/amylovoran biosynthesis glycosyltransferase
VVHRFPQLSETFIVNKFLGLLDRGWDVQVVCGTSRAEDWRKFPALEQRPGMRSRVHRGWPARPRGLALVLAPLAMAYAWASSPAQTMRYLRLGGREGGGRVLSQFYLDATVVALRPDLVHFEFGPLAAGNMHLRRWLGCRVVTSFRGYDLNYAGLEDPHYYDDVWRYADALHLLGEDLWRRAQRRGCPASKPHHLIPPAIDLAFFDPGARQHRDITGTAARPLRILSVGRLEWKKGYEYALQAVQQLVRQGIACEYRILGDGNFLEAVAFARHQLGLDRQVHLLGGLPRVQVRDEMLRADVFLHAAVSEGFCNAVLEAQAMKLPVVTSDADGLAENVAHGESGYVEPRRQPQALVGPLVALAGDPELRERLGDQGRRRVSSRFRLDDQVRAFDAFYRQVLGPPAGAGLGDPPGGRAA